MPNNVFRENKIDYKKLSTDQLYSNCNILTLTFSTICAYPSDFYSYRICIHKYNYEEKKLCFTIKNKAVYMCQRTN